MTNICLKYKYDCDNMENIATYSLKYAIHFLLQFIQKPKIMLYEILIMVNLNRNLKFVKQMPKSRLEINFILFILFMYVCMYVYIGMFIYM